MIELWVHFPENGIVEKKSVAYYLKQIISFFCDAIDVEYLHWYLSSDTRNIGLTWQLNKETLHTWDPEITQYLDDYLDLDVSAVFDIGVKKPFERNIYGGAVVAQSRRGLTVPKIEGEYTIRLVIADAVWEKVSRTAIQELIESITSKTKGSFSINKL
ncbi:MAG: hypothetical protein IJ769_03185 [Clostridia bacterium]|nr:hypothetical protein [Clostridia bacterium]